MQMKLVKLLQETVLICYICCYIFYLSSPIVLHKIYSFILRFSTSSAFLRATASYML